jgi:hypothetical protein
MKTTFLEFEQPVAELEAKIEQLIFQKRLRACRRKARH